MEGKEWNWIMKHIVITQFPWFQKSSLERNFCFCTDLKDVDNKWALVALLIISGLWEVFFYEFYENQSVDHPYKDPSPTMNQIRQTNLSSCFYISGYLQKTRQRNMVIFTLKKKDWYPWVNSIFEILFFSSPLGKISPVKKRRVIFSICYHHWIQHYFLVIVLIL